MDRGILPWLRRSFLKYHRPSSRLGSGTGKPRIRHPSRALHSKNPRGRFSELPDGLCQRLKNGEQRSRFGEGQFPRPVIHVDEISVSGEPVPVELMPSFATEYSSFEAVSDCN